MTAELLTRHRQDPLLAMGSAPAHMSWIARLRKTCTLAPAARSKLTTLATFWSSSAGLFHTSAI